MSDEAAPPEGRPLFRSLRMLLALILVASGTVLAVSPVAAGHDQSRPPKDCPKDSHGGYQLLGSKDKKGGRHCKPTTTRKSTTTTSMKPTTTSTSTTTSTTTSSTSTTTTSTTTSTSTSTSSTSTTTTTEAPTTTVMPTTTATDGPFAFSATPRCTLDAPWVDLEASAEGFSGNYTLNWVDADGVTRLTQEVPLGSFSTLYPAAITDSEGNGIDWPGWVEQTDGTWLEEDDGFAWVREPGVTVFAEINPTSSPVALEYPPATPTCNPGPEQPPGENVLVNTTVSSPSGGTPSEGLAFSGGSPLPGLVVGLGFVVAGFLLMILERRRLVST